MKGIGKECNMKLSRRDVLVILALVMVIAAILGLDRGTVLTSGHASAAKPGAQAALRSEASDAAAKEAFDYFPDHYADQAQEPAEPIATF
jgi:hypothetical protein